MIDENLFRQREWTTETLAADCAIFGEGFVNTLYEFDRCASGNGHVSSLVLLMRFDSVGN